MREVKVYQIGLRGTGRYGFEKLVEMEKHMPEVDVSLEAVCDRDRERLERAERFADVHGVDIDSFTDTDAMYEAAGGGETVLIYDSSSSRNHPDQVYESLRNGFFHVTERASSLTKDEHISERKMAENEDVKYLADRLERQNPAVRKALEITGEEKIESIKVFREGSTGIQKILSPVDNLDIKGGDVLNKMMHQSFVQDFLPEERNFQDLDLKEADTEYFVPKGKDSGKLMSVDGGYTRNINRETATGMTHADLGSETVIELNSSWLGLSKEFRSLASDIRDETGEEVFEREFAEKDDSAYIYEDARAFIIRGSRNLAGDMLNEKLYDLDTGEEVGTRDMLHDQLYRVLENAVLEAAGLRERPDREGTGFVEKLFEIKNRAIQDKEFFEELEKANDKLESMIIEDGKILEDEEANTLAR